MLEVVLGRRREGTCCRSSRSRLLLCLPLRRRVIWVDGCAAFLYLARLPAFVGARSNVRVADLKCKHTRDWVMCFPFFLGHLFSFFALCQVFRLVLFFPVRTRVEKIVLSCLSSCFLCEPLLSFLFFLSINTNPAAVVVGFPLGPLALVAHVRPPAQRARSVVPFARQRRGPFFVPPTFNPFSPSTDLFYDDRGRAREMCQRETRENTKRRRRREAMPPSRATARQQERKKRAQPRDGFATRDRLLVPWWTPLGERITPPLLWPWRRLVTPLWATTASRCGRAETDAHHQRTLTRLSPLFATRQPEKKDNTAVFKAYLFGIPPFG